MLIKKGEPNMNLILVGLLFALFRFDYAFFSQNVDTTIVIDVLPDFLGYLLIWFGLEKAVNVIKNALAE